MKSFGSLLAIFDQVRKASITLQLSEVLGLPLKSSEVLEGSLIIVEIVLPSTNKKKNISITPSLCSLDWSN